MYALNKVTVMDIILVMTLKSDVYFACWNARKTRVQYSETDIRECLCLRQSNIFSFFKLWGSARLLAIFSIYIVCVYVYGMGKCKSIVKNDKKNSIAEVQYSLQFFVYEDTNYI